MEEFIINLAGDWSIVAVPIFVGVLASFVIKAIDLLTPEKVISRLLVFLVCVILGIASNFVFPEIVVGWKDFVMVSLMNIAVAFIFYNFGGNTIVDFLMGKVFGKVKELGG